MLIAGEASGDKLAAELVVALRDRLSARPFPRSSDPQPLDRGFPPTFFGAGGAAMEAAGVEIITDLTQHSVIGLVSVFRKLREFRRLFYQLLDEAARRQPDVIVCVDFGGFNRRFAGAVRKWVDRRNGPFHNWRPKLVQFVSPQVWASRPGRAYSMERDLDLLLTIFPFEPAWYAERTPGLNVKFVGHPMLDRYAGLKVLNNRLDPTAEPRVVLLPGSRAAELKRHLPVMLEAVKLIRTSQSCRIQMVLPGERLRRIAEEFDLTGVETRVGDLPTVLNGATLAIASTGTVTMECAWFGVPTVALYITSPLEFQIGKRIVTVKHLSMPNILADDRVFPEFVQQDATPANLAEAALELLRDPVRHEATRNELKKIVATLGAPGAATRAADAILQL